MENWELAGHGGPECFKTDDGLDEKKKANCFAWCRVNTENMTERGADERSRHRNSEGVGGRADSGVGSSSSAIGIKDPG